MNADQHDARADIITFENIALHLGVSVSRVKKYIKTGKTRLPEQDKRTIDALLHMRDAHRNKAKELRKQND